MPRIASVGTAVPPYEIAQTDVQSFARQIFGEAFKDIDRYMPIFENAQIQKRHFCVPLDWFGEEYGVGSKNDLYIENAKLLAAAAIHQCLEQSGLDPKDIDHLYFISTTGMATPSLDARLIYEVGFRPNMKRTPIWGLGCAGGAVGLSRGYEYAKAFPKQRVLVVSVECCGLTFQRNRLTKSNLVATSLFADGAAAVLIEGDEVQSHATLPQTGFPRIVDTMSMTWEDSLDVMGWNITDEGLEVLFSRDIPTIVHSLMKPNIDQFLEDNEVRTEQISRYITHPGGMKVIEAYRESLGLEEEALKYPRDILKNYGNMSSASVLFVLRENLSDPGEPGTYGLVTALGPGFSSELVLVEW